MSRQLAAQWLRPRSLLGLAVGIVAVAALAVALQPVVPASGAPVSAPPAQLTDQGVAVVFQVHPTFIKFPEERKKGHGVWFVGAGLEAGQEVKIRMVWGIEGLETDITSVLDVGFDEDLGGLFANVHGALAVAFERGFRGSSRDFLFYGEWQPVSFRLHDALTGELLAVAPAVLCGPALEEKWCNASSDLAPIK